MNYKIITEKKDVKILKLIMPLLILFLMIVILFNTEKYMASALSGVNIWLKAVFPSLFPFLFFTKVLSEYDLIKDISVFFKKPMAFLFKTGGLSAFIFLSSIVSGYPLGAKLTSDLVAQNAITKEEAQKILSFSSTSGPLFIIGSVATGMFLDVRLGFTLYLSHILGAILNGILWGRLLTQKKKKNCAPSDISLSKTNFSIGECMYSAIQSILLVAGFIVVFNIIIDAVNTLPFLAAKNTFTAFFNGFIEVTRGALDLSLAPSPLTPVLLSFLISFGGLSIFFQALSFIEKCGIRKSLYFTQKITHGIFSALTTFLLLLI